MSSTVMATKKAREWITIGEAARRLGCSRTCVRKMIEDGRLTTKTLSYWHKVDAAEIEAIDRDSIQPATAGV